MLRKQILISMLCSCFAIFVVNLRLPNSTRTNSMWVHWQAPFLSGSGYGSEALAYIHALDRALSSRVSISHHGDSVKFDFIRGLSESERRALSILLQRSPPTRNVIEVCHSEPGAWKPALYETPECPNRNAAFTIGRTMFETDRIPRGWADRLNRMNEVWVPTEWQKKVFLQNGVDADKIFVFPEAVDVDFFNPAKVVPMSLAHRKSSGTYIFLSIFKFERRKAWNLLLEAFYSEFRATDKVALYILTQGYHQDDENIPSQKVQQFTEDFMKRTNSSLSDLPQLTLLEHHIPQRSLPSLYAAANAFVLPSRGEGWGRPHSEAMAMGLCTIATNWSGNTEFMNHENSFLIPIEGMERVGEGPFADHMWSIPSLSHLRKIMRTAFENPQLCAEKGEIARADMCRHFSPAAVADVASNRLRQIARKFETDDEVSTESKNF